MSVLVWPSDLPGPVQGTYSVNPQDTVLRTQLDAGPAKLRRRFTAAVAPTRFTLALNQAELVTLLDFYDNVVQAVLPFDWIDPRTEALAEYRFTAPPQYTAVDDGQYEVKVSLERLP